MIPLVVGSAGHELGMNSMSGASIDKDEIYSNSYLAYFPQHYPRVILDNGDELITNEKVPDISERSNFFIHTLGNDIMLMTLDYGYT